jgi:hypothetical protein
LREDLALVGGLGPAGGFLISSPPGPELVAATAQLCSWVASERGMPVVCKVALGFYQAVVLSPMPGSDHAARLWPTMELIRRGILPDQILPFTDWFEGQQSEFQHHLRGVIDRFDLDSWVRFVATVIQRACLDQLRQIAELVQTGDELAGPYVQHDQGRATGPGADRQPDHQCCPRGSAFGHLRTVRPNTAQSAPAGRCP